jgi:hypothetical protein
MHIDFLSFLRAALIASAPGMETSVCSVLCPVAGRTYACKFSRDFDMSFRSRLVYFGSPL